MMINEEYEKDESEVIRMSTTKENSEYSGNSDWSE
jgi:hypothetical protein